MSKKLLIFATKMNVRLVTLSFPQCSEWWPLPCDNHLNSNQESLQQQQQQHRVLLSVFYWGYAGRDINIMLIRRGRGLNQRSIIKVKSDQRTVRCWCCYSYIFGLISVTIDFKWLFVVVGRSKSEINHAENLRVKYWIFRGCSTKMCIERLGHSAV